MKKGAILRNLPFVLAAVLPVAFVLVVMLMALMPSLTIQPEHDFLYRQEENSAYLYRYGYMNEYRIEDGRVVLVPSEAYTPGTDQAFSEAPRLYYYDVETDSATEISYEDARELAVAPGPTSPDGYLVEHRYSSSGAFGIFGGGSGNNNGYYITKGGAGKRLPALLAGSRGYYDNVAIIGWVK